MRPYAESIILIIFLIYINNLKHNYYIVLNLLIIYIRFLLKCNALFY